MASTDDALAVVGLLLVTKTFNRRKRMKRNIWCKNWLKKRERYSHVNLLNELKFAPKDWHNYLRMDEETYLRLLSLVTPLIIKKDTVMREAIPPHQVDSNIKISSDWEKLRGSKIHYNNITSVFKLYCTRDM